MNAVPAKIAGVEELIMVTPPMKDGKANPDILTAAAIARGGRVFLMGGAQARGGSGLRHGKGAQGGQDRGAGKHFCGHGPRSSCTAPWTLT